MKICRYIFRIIVLLGLIGIAVWIVMKIYPHEKSPVSSDKARIADIRALTDLCTVEIYSDVPVKGRIGTRHFFARQTQMGTISFPLDSVSIVSDSDTLRLTLPKEKVELMESTDPDAFQIIDTWNTNMFGSAHFTNAEETRIKQLVRDYSIKSLYTDGIVARARKEAVEALQNLLETLTGMTVIVTDTIQ